MKKSSEKLIAISLGVVSVIFVVFFMLVILFPNIAYEADNRVVHILFAMLMIAFGVLTALNIRGSFMENEKINQILIFKTKESSRKASVKVIRQLAKRAASSVEGATVGGLHLFIDNENEVIMKASVKVDVKAAGTNQAMDVVERVEHALTTEFMTILGFEFKTIELKLTKVLNAPKPDEQKHEDTKSEPKHETKHDTHKEVKETVVHIEEAIEEVIEATGEEVRD